MLFCMDGLIFNLQKFSLHDGPGIRTDVFFQGCNMRCKWCSNPESFDMHPTSPNSEAKEYSVDELMTELLKDKTFYDASGGGVTLTGGEALLQYDFLYELCDALHREGIHILLETSGNAPPWTFQLVLQKCDTLYIDLKHYDKQKHIDGTGVPLTQILENLRTALESDVPTVVRIPVIPGFNNSVEDIEGYATLLDDLDANEIHLLPFHQLGQHKYESLGMNYSFNGVASPSEKDMETLAQVLRERGFNVHICAWR